VFKGVSEPEREGKFGEKEGVELGRMGKKGVGQWLRYLNPRLQ